MNKELEQQRTEQLYKELLKQPTVFTLTVPELMALTNMTRNSIQRSLRILVDQKKLEKIKKRNTYKIILAQQVLNKTKTYKKLDIDRLDDWYYMDKDKTTEIKYNNIQSNK